MDDDADPAIRFDANQVCSYCREWDDLKANHVLTADRASSECKRIVGEIREAGRGKEYDCVLGISGGVDSTYLAYMAKELGLRPLVFHFDNGWNSELAVKNIENICRRLGFHLHTHVVEWDEFRDLHLAYLKASVIDIEVPTDHAINALGMLTAARIGVRFVLTGCNFATESPLPKAWVWEKMDLLNLRAIQRRYGTKRLKTLPMLGFLKGSYYQVVKRIRFIDLLNFLPYQKDRAKTTIERVLGWRDYGGKHYESIFTRFYQGYILPTKFGVDKRKAHLSSLIRTGQMTRQEALAELSKPPYAAQLLKTDREFVLKKLGLTDERFDEIMRKPRVEHDQFPSYRKAHYRYHKQLFDLIRPVTRLLKRGAAR